MKATVISSTILLVLLNPSFLPAQSVCSPGKHAKLPSVIYMTYHKARKRLLKAGWQPYQTIHHNSAETDPNISVGNGKEFWEKGYWEIEMCSGTGLAACSFLFEDAYGNRLRVNTAGEEIPEEKTHAIVTRYKFVCEKDE